jgi:hypothetical protein
MHFSGDTFDPDRDGERLGAQMAAVFALMRDGAWRTLGEIAAQSGAPEASVSARLRDIRNKLGYTVEREYVAHGLHRYRVVEPVRIQTQGVLFDVGHAKPEEPT